jgi:hypothetical protein
MKTLLAIELLKTQAKNQRLNEMNTVKQIIKLSNEWACDEWFTIGWMEETDMMIDIDEKFMEVDGLCLEDWLKKHFEITHESDKHVVFKTFSF